MGWMNVHLPDHAGNHIAVALRPGRLGGMVGVVSLFYAVVGLDLDSTFVSSRCSSASGPSQRCGGAAAGGSRRGLSLDAVTPVATPV